jgi:hypothetical protein
MIRELGCRWPVQVWYRGGDPVNVRDLPEDVDLLDVGATVASFGVDLPPDRSRDATLAARYTTFDRVVLLDADTYPNRAPCRLEAEIGRAAVTTWAGLGPVPALIDRTVSRVELTGIAPVRELATLTRATGTICHLGGHPTFVRLKADRPGSDVPADRRYRELLDRCAAST